jgi:hypothetical protein
MGRFVFSPQKQSSQRAKTNYYRVPCRSKRQVGTSSHKAKFISY